MLAKRIKGLFVW